ncbi:MAG TPA: methionyl-tRNA formyltransferase [Candidatus Latescibacteria bacterium]|nr:methionyl-tRNA formyltransferase [Candidatus Latescibacterota bacterium]
MRTLRIVFMGSPEFSVPSLARLLEGPHRVVGVVTRPDRPRGRGRRLEPTPVKELALKVDLPVSTPERLRDKGFLSELKALDADLFVVVAFRVLPEAVLQLPKGGVVNLHPSLLPKYRGPAPIQWAIINGERETGATTLFIEPEVDTGDIILQERVPIGPDETAGELHDRLKVLGADLLAHTVDLIAEGKASRIPQPPGDWPRAPKLTKEHARIRWEGPAEALCNLIRGTNPIPGAFTAWRDRVLKVHRARIVPEVEGKPGEVVQADGRAGMVVAAGEGGLYLTEVQLEGGRKMSSAEFVRGHRVEVGERLGEFEGSRT